MYIRLRKKEKDAYDSVCVPIAILWDASQLNARRKFLAERVIGRIKFESRIGERIHNFFTVSSRRALSISARSSSLI